ncbi:DUF600 domain-containing protein [Rossellomorea marisflavi]|uniref:DUF600 domain-containing protein n=1 Tax=Rossellomorea marisflavi TaxID=189381 RepID=UPI0028893AE6|nr:DUF600 domain-containing protein [Rossellomorea marisflavi]
MEPSSTNWGIICTTVDAWYDDRCVIADGSLGKVGVCMKVFEEYISELQTNLVELCLDFVDWKADEIYMYGSYEPDAYYFNAFFNVQGKMVLKHKLNDTSFEKNNNLYDLSTQRQIEFQRIGTEILEEIHKRCKEFNSEMPTEMKLRYIRKNNKLQGRYNYDVVYSHDEELLPNNVFKAWFEEVKEGKKKRNEC